MGVPMVPYGATPRSRPNRIGDRSREPRDAGAVGHRGDPVTRPTQNLVKAAPASFWRASSCCPVEGARTGQGAISAYEIGFWRRGSDSLLLEVVHIQPPVASCALVWAEHSERELAAAKLDNALRHTQALAENDRKLLYTHLHL